jgi:hypothetical protein
MSAQRLAATFALLGLAFVCSGAETKSRPGDMLFSGANVPQFQLSFAPVEWEKLRLDNRRYVRATVLVGTNSLQDVAVRLKGHGSFRPLEDRPSLTLKFDEFKDGQKLDGLTKVLLNNASQDTSLMSEYIASGMFRDAGVPAARVAHARVQLNGRDLGFYVLAEGMNKVFLKQHFGDSSGVLYDANAIDIDRHLQQSNGPTSDQSELAALVAAARRAPEEGAKGLAAALDVERFLSFLAVSVLGAQHDSYPLNRNNYRLYRDPASRRFVMMPHGIDGSFSRNSMPLALGSNYVLTRAIVQTPVLQQSYRERVARLFTNVFNIEVLTNRVRAAVDRLRAAAMNDAERVSLDARAKGFARRIAERHRNVANELGGASIAPVALARGSAQSLTNWTAEVGSGTATFATNHHNGTVALQIHTGPGDSVASWRQRLLLAPGSYRFYANVRLETETGGLPSGRNGIAVRISGRPAPMRNPTAGQWAPTEFQFTIREGEEDVQFVCECRGPNTQAWFEMSSLLVRRE